MQMRSWGQVVLLAIMMAVFRIAGASDPCKNEVGWIGVQCHGKYIDQIKVQLKDAEERIRTEIKSSNYEAKKRDEWLVKFNQTQNQWAVYVQSDCSLIRHKHPDAMSGTAMTSALLLCKIEHIESRIGQLKNLHPYW
jgi:uncharacterized protein YecT (DUF1311 family)